jgi:hypothetical protein
MDDPFVYKSVTYQKLLYLYDHLALSEEIQTTNNFVFFNLQDWKKIGGGDKLLINSQFFAGSLNRVKTTNQNKFVGFICCRLM